MPKRPEIGILDTKIDSDHFFMNDVMHCMNSNARKITTYKYAFFKCILDNLFNATLENDGFYHLPFSFLTNSFSRIYWNLASKYNIPQIHNGRKNIMVEIYKEIKDNPKFKVEGLDFDVICDEAKKLYINKTKSQITKDVLWALYTDFNYRIYGYDKKKKYIYFSKESYQFLTDFKDALEKINYYSWIKWTENILDIAHKTVSNLSSKLDEEPERISLERFKKDLIKKGDEFKCFYCGKDLLSSKVHLDHFIPWSFIKDNQSWNFVFACSTCNEQKKDKIPESKYLLKLFKRNKKLFGKTYEANLQKSYDAALHNGFNLWKIK